MELCKRKLNSLVLVACLAAAPALAQTCPAPFPIVNGQAHAGSTCNYSNSLPMVDGFDLPHRDVVYRLTTNSPLGGQISFGSSPSGHLEAWILSGCSTSATAIAAYSVPASGTTISLPSRPAGNYFLVITTDSSLPGNLPICGAYQFTPSIVAAATVGTCQAPLPFQSGQHPIGSTCPGGNPLPSLMGILPSPQRDQVYRINRSSIANSRLKFDASPTGLLAVVMKTCSPDADIVAFQDLPAGTPKSLNLATLPAGDHYLVITGDPAGPAMACGNYGFSDY